MSSGAHLASYSIGTGVLSRGKSGRGLKFTTHLHLAARLWMSGGQSLHPLYAFMAWTGKALPFLLSVTPTLLLSNLPLFEALACRWIISESWHKEINCRKYSFVYRPPPAAWFMPSSNKWYNSQRQVYVTYRLCVCTVIRKWTPLSGLPWRLVTSFRNYFILNVSVYVLVSLPKRRT